MDSKTLNGSNTRYKKQQRYKNHTLPIKWGQEQDVAYELAIRHPCVRRILNRTDSAEISLEDGETLYYEFGINTYNLRILDNGKKIDEFTKDVLYLNYDFISYRNYYEPKNIMVPNKGFFTADKLSLSMLSKVEYQKKLTPQGSSKNGLMFSTFLSSTTLSDYDAIEIYKNSYYSLDKTTKYKNEIKRKNKLIKDYIKHKRWFELLTPISYA